jgi:hypothetical protein
MPPKLRVIHRIFSYCQCLYPIDYWLLIGKFSLAREEERGSTDPGGLNEGSCMSSNERIDFNRRSGCFIF